MYLTLNVYLKIKIQIQGYIMQSLNVVNTFNGILIRI